ncbi:MAG: hypothetical protein RRC34_02500 [Lentisphaeria bacterium]|nr:hypothetical protein [Lentisphaeria bacterium]
MEEVLIALCGTSPAEPDGDDKDDGDDGGDSGWRFPPPAAIKS